MIRSLLRDTQGVAAVEFALLAPAFFAFIFLVIEGGRMIWTQQVLQETAFASARCLGVRSSRCPNRAATITYAINRARSSGVRLAAGTVDPNNTTATCNGRSGMTLVVITSPYSTVVGSILPDAVSALTVRACFPNV